MESFTMPDNLPAVQSAKLPELYESARHYLAECVRIDEVKDWADKTAALASYARQSDNEELEKFAMRIRARAIRRCGELLRALGTRTNNGADTDTESQRETAERAGISKRREVTAVRLSKIPEAEFESALASENPPTITQLAERGKKPGGALLDLAAENPEEFSCSTHGQGFLEEFAEFCGRVRPASVVRGALPREHRAMRLHVGTISAWLDQLIIELGGLHVQRKRSCG